MENNVYTELGKNIIAVLPKNWERVCFGLFSIFVEFTFRIKEEIK